MHDKNRPTNEEIYLSILLRREEFESSHMRCNRDRDVIPVHCLRENWVPGTWNPDLIPRRMVFLDTSISITSNSKGGILVFASISF